MGNKGRAGDDGSLGYQCCCALRSSAQQPCGGNGTAPPPPDESASLQFTAFRTASAAAAAPGECGAALATACARSDRSHAACEICTGGKHRHPAACSSEDIKRFCATGDAGGESIVLQVLNPLQNTVNVSVATSETAGFSFALPPGFATFVW